MYLLFIFSEQPVYACLMSNDAVSVSAQHSIYQHGSRRPVKQFYKSKTNHLATYRDDHRIQKLNLPFICDS